MQARASPRGLELLYQSAPPCPEQAYPRLQRAHTTATPFCLPEPPRPRLQLPPPRSELHRDSDSVDSYKSDGSANNYKPIKKTTPNHYVDMAQTIKEIAVNKEKAAMVRRHTTEYRGPSAPLTLPVPSPAHVRPYPYLVLTEQRYTKKKSEDNGIKLKMRPDEWKDDRQPPPRVECQTVDRRSTKKHARATKMKRQGSFNIDPSGEFHLSLDTQQKDMSRSARSCNPRSPLMDARPPPLQISAEDMVQMANCGARNKNGSLCHFISADPPSSSEAELALPRKFRTTERRKKSTPSLVSESSEETLRRDGARRRAGKPRVKETARVKEGARRGYLPLEEEACKCLVISSHSLAKASREELGVEESFDF